MKSLWICAILWLLSMAAPGWISTARSSAAPATAAARTPPDYSGYVHLHATRHDLHAGNAGARAGMCVD